MIMVLVAGRNRSSFYFIGNIIISCDLNDKFTHNESNY